SSDSQRDKFASAISKFQEKQLNGAQEVVSNVFAFVDNTNSGEFERGRLEIDKFPRFLDTGTQGEENGLDFAVNFFAGLAGDFLNEKTGLLDFVKALRKEGLKRLQAILAADNTRAMFDYATFVTQGLPNKEGIYEGGMRLWTKEQADDNKSAITD